MNSAATGTNAGTSWTNACTSFAQLLATAFAAGDDCDVKNTHNETTASAVTLTWPGTAAAPNRIFSCDSTNAPAQASDLLAGAKMSTTGASAITWNGSFYVYGVTLSAGNSTNVAGVRAASSGGNFQVWDTCSWIMNNTGSSISVIGLNSNTEVVFINTTVTFGAVGQTIEIGGRVRWYDTASAILTTVPTTLFTPGLTCTALLSGVDLSAVNTTLVGAGSFSNSFLLLNCRLNASITVAVTPTSLGFTKVDLVNCDSGATGYRQERYWYSGTLTTSTTVYNNATDGDTPISWQVVTTANAKRYVPFECFEIVQWVAAGTYANSFVAITSATAGLTNADVWVECQALTNASYPLGALVTSAPATQLTAGGGLTVGVWAVGGAGNNYQLSIPAFTTNIDGYMRFVVKVGKASLTVYIDPAVTVAP